MKNWLRKRLIRWIVKDLFNTIDETDILNIKKIIDNFGKEKVIGVYLNNRKLNQSEVDALKESVEQFKGSVIWKLLSNQVKYLSNKKMYETGDVMAGQIANFVIKVIEKTIEGISKL